MSGTCVGAKMTQAGQFALPSPTSPCESSPQHKTAPLLSSAHVCNAPVTTPFASEMFGTRAGNGLFLLPVPSCPYSFDPQQSSSPLSRRMQVCPTPPVTAVTPLAPTTGLGEGFV